VSRATNQRPLRIAITTGDLDGVGLEVTAKALAKIGSQEDVVFYLWRSPRCPAKYLHTIDRRFKRVTFSSWPDALKASITSRRTIVDISSNLPPPLWVEITAQAAYFGHINGMTTGPLSKTLIVSSGLKDMGHTGILQRVSKSKDLFMGFIGNEFNVVLATGHIPIDQVTAKLSADKLNGAITSANELRQILGKKQSTRPIALLGLNPHAGEDGLIGATESHVHKAALQEATAKGILLEGPLVPDAAFFKSNWKKYSVFVANYHDQGLIPFKMIHGQESGIQLTMGLPFVRTSVDHGTAKDIFGKDKADASSMRMAIDWAIKLSRAKMAR
jgi:4-hydroxythreonine-4-phosphate dehydrogenase